MCNKKTSLIISGLLSFGLLVWNYIGNYRVCDFFMKGGSATNCPFVLTNIAINLLPIIPLFLFSLITYKMRDEVYRAWLRFANVWIPLSIVLIFLAPEYAGGFGITLYAVTKSSVAFLSSLLFVIISLVLIIYKHFSTSRIR